MAKGAAQTKSEADALGFEDILKRLEDVVTQLETGELPLEKSLAVFEEGVRLSRLGSDRLDQAERRVEELLAQGDKMTTRSLDVDGAQESS